MKLFFDYQIFEFQTYGGISRFYAETISALNSIGIDTIVGVKRSDNVHLRQFLDIKHLKHKHYLGQRTLEQRLPNLMERLHLKDANRYYCEKILKKSDFDFFEPTYYDSYFLPFLNGRPFSLEIHDMIPELYPQYFPTDDFQIVQKKLLAPLADIIRVPSLKTKDDLVNILNINPDKIYVIPRGTPTLPHIDIQPPIDKPYILYVGERGLYKNFNSLLKEFSHTSNDIHLICTGKPFSNSELQTLAQYGLSDRVTHCFASDETLYSLYHYAVAFVYPSDYEGFGLPILEAFDCGCPVLLNNISVFHEVANDAALFFDINNDGEFCEKLDSLFTVDTRNELIKRGYERKKCFSWENSANNTLRALQQISPKEINIYS